MNAFNIKNTNFSEVMNMPGIQSTLPYKYKDNDMFISINLWTKI